MVRGETDLMTLQKDLEAEGHEWSNKKFHKVTEAIKAVHFRFTRLTGDDKAAQLTQELTERCITTKASEQVIAALVETIQTYSSH